MQQVRRLAAVLCSITADINFELKEQSEQCSRIIDKVLAAAAAAAAASFCCCC